MERFYWRLVDDTEMLVCLECERETIDLVRACRFHVVRDVVRDGTKLAHQCTRCGARIEFWRGRKTATRRDAAPAGVNRGEIQPDSRLGRAGGIGAGAPPVALVAPW